MRTRIILPVLLSCVTIFSCSKETLKVEAEPLVKKNVEFKIFATSDFSEAVYNDVKAEVRLSINSIDTRSGKTSTVWDTTFAARSVRDYPKENNAVHIKKELLNVSDSKTKITAAVARMYDYKGSLASEAKFETLEDGNCNKLMEVVFND